MSYSMSGMMSPSCVKTGNRSSRPRVASGYRPDQDIVIPPRTCLQDSRREEFGDIAKVRPIRQRANLGTFKGSPWGQGATIRQRVTCPRPYAKLEHTRLEGGSAKESYWNTYPSGKDYLATLNDTVFCPLPAGITGE
jgi:hypothetical protein